MKKLILLAGVLSCSLASVFVRFATAPSPVLVLYRMSITVALLLPMLLAKHRQEVSALPRRTLLLCIASGISLGFHFTTYFESLRHTTIAASSVLTNLEVVFVALFTVFLFHKPLPRLAWASILIALCGMALVSLSASGGAGTPLGNLLALSAAAFLAIYTMLGTVCRRSASTSVYTFFAYLSAAGTVLVIDLLTRTPLWGYGPVNLLCALGMAIFCTLLGHSVFSWSLKYLPPAFVSTVKLLDPIPASIWGVILFHEALSFTTVLGGGLVILGILLYGRTVEGTDA